MPVFEERGRHAGRQHVRCNLFPSAAEVLTATHQIITRRHRRGYQEFYNDHTISLVGETDAHP